MYIFRYLTFTLLCLGLLSVHIYAQDNEAEGADEAGAEGDDGDDADQHRSDPPATIPDPQQHPDSSHQHPDPSQQQTHDQQQQHSHDPSQQHPHDPSQQRPDYPQQPHDPSQQHPDPSQHYPDPSQQQTHDHQRQHSQDPSQQHPYDPSQQRPDYPQQPHDPSQQHPDPSQQHPDPSQDRQQEYRPSYAQPQPHPFSQAHAHVMATPTCSDNSQCHTQAQCQNGCCKCPPPYFGNGKLCFDKDTPQRMTGKISGTLNGVQIPEATMHNYILVQEGRTYVAYSPIPSENGDSLQTILPVATLIGWLFATTDGTHMKNGATLTGGTVNHSATVTFTGNGQPLTVNVDQKITGPDEHNMLYSTLTVNGQAPTVQSGQSLEFQDHQIEFHHVAAGRIQAFSRNTLTIDGRAQEYTVDEVITFQECGHNPAMTDNEKISNLHVSRVQSLYQQQDKASRFGMDTRMGAFASSDSDGEDNLDQYTQAPPAPTAGYPNGQDSGQGYVPTAAPAPMPGAPGEPKICRGEEECGPDAECVPNYVIRQYVCQCKAGFSGDGMNCYAGGVAPPVVVPSFEGTGAAVAGEAPDCAGNRTICSPVAECQIKKETGRGYCVCFIGYVGNGYECHDPTQVTATAQPATGYPPTGYPYPYPEPATQAPYPYPYPYPGYETTQPPYRPYPEPQPPGSCYDNPMMCDRNAACKRSDRGQFTCECLSGFEGDGITCRMRPQSRGGFLAFTQGMSVMKIPLDHNSLDRGSQVAIIPGQTAVGIATDCVDSYIYWSDIAGHNINRARYDGSENEVVLRSVQSAEGLSIDFISRNIFWTDSAADHIAVAKLADMKAGYKVIISKNLYNPRAIVAHPGRGTIYWSDWNREAPKIETSSMDGSDRKVLINTNLGLPNALSIDFTTDDLCWADAGVQRVECSTIDGQNRRVVVVNTPYPFSMTYNDGMLYWTDWSLNKIQSASKYGGASKTHELPIGSSGKVYGIAAVPDYCPRVTNACANGNGGCTHICLPLANGQHKCACPDNVAADLCREA